MIKYYDDKDKWYHEISSQEDAEKLLKSDEDLENGSFLVMPNSSESEDFILSVLYQNEIFHYQIHRVPNAEDPFYSINGTKQFHGVDTIIEYYSDPQHITTNSLIINLSKPMKGDLPPKDILCHGRTNLLHRAITENDEKRILELLKEDDRNINARDQDDLTAAHLACLYECSEKTFKLILKAGAKISLKDASGNTPLHYACRTKSAGFIKALIDGNADIIHMRNPETGYVALHDAAKFGNIKAIQLLMKAGATTMPRTKLIEFPLDLAIEAGHFEIAEYLKRYSIEPAKSKRTYWYHGTLNRQEANKLVQEYEAVMREKLMKKNKRSSKKIEKIPIYANVETDASADTENVSSAVQLDEVNADVDLSNQPSTDGVFLIRQSARSGYALSLWSDNQVKHFIISESIQHFYLDDGPYFLSLEHLVQHYSTFSDGLPINLRFPVPPKSKPPLPAFSSMPKSQKKRLQTQSLNGDVLPELPEKTAPKTPLRYFSHPGEEALKRIGGLFERSPTPSTPSSSSGNSSNQQLDGEATEDKLDNEKRDSSIFASLRFSKTSPKKNFIIDGMRSLRKNKNKLSLHKTLSMDEKEKQQQQPDIKPRSIFHDVDDLIRQQQLNDPEFNIRSAQDIMKDLCFQVNFVDSIYKVPSNILVDNNNLQSVDEDDSEEKSQHNDSNTQYELEDEIIKEVDRRNSFVISAKDKCNNVSDADDTDSIKDSSIQLSCSDIRSNNQSDIESSNDDKQSLGLIRNSLESNYSNCSFDFKPDSKSIAEGTSDNSNNAENDDDITAKALNLN